MSGLEKLRGLADAANARGDRTTCLRIHSTISRLEVVLAAIDRLNAALDTAGAPRFVADDEPAFEARANA